jgi:two-component system, LytTR family, sensor kinase
MKKSFVVFLHVSYWFMYAMVLVFIFAGLRWRIEPTPTLGNLFYTHPLGIMSTVPNIFAFYGFYFWVFPFFLTSRKLWYALLAGIVVAFTGAVIGSVVLYIKFTELRNVFVIWDEIFNFLTWMTLVALVHGALALIIRGFISWYEDLKNKEALTKKNFEMEMALVKSQLDPHFLFNTINNIDILISRDAAKASAYLNKLSDIMRFMLYETKSERIPLQKEWTYLEKYIELQKIRTVHPNFVAYTIDGNTDGVLIAPMTFIPFVENAFKHAEGTKMDHALHINIVVKQDAISFECRNKYLRSDSPKLVSSGLGNNLITKRLSLLYPNKHELNIIDHEETYTVKLNINRY